MMLLIMMIMIDSSGVTLTMINGLVVIDNTDY